MTASGRESWLEILGRLLGPGEGFTTTRLCQVCADVTGVTGAGIMLMAGDVPRGSVCTTDTVSELIEQLQYDLGEGPCVDAYHQASGMVAAQLDVSVNQALLRLRAHAFGNDRSLTDVARDVVERRLRFDPDGDSDRSTGRSEPDQNP